MSERDWRMKTNPVDDGLVELAKFDPLKEVELAGKKWRVKNISLKDFRSLAEKKTLMLKNLYDDNIAIDFAISVLKASLRDGGGDNDGNSNDDGNPPTDEDFEQMSTEVAQALAYARLIYHQNTNPLEYRTKFTTSLLKIKRED